MRRLFGEGINHALGEEYTTNSPANATFTRPYIDVEKYVLTMLWTRVKQLH